MTRKNSLRGLPSFLARWSDQLFAIDTRSLALFRIGLGALLLVDLLQRAADLAAHYSDAGVLPRAVLLDRAEPIFSIHVLTGGVSGLALLFGTAILLALLVLVGWRPQLSSALSWLLLISLHDRNTYLLNNSDYLMQFLIFWAIFLPTGVRWSIESALSSSGERPPGRILSVGTGVILVQVALVYLITGLKKTAPEWRWEGTAVYYGLNIDQFVTPFGKSLLQYPELLWWATHASMILELVIAFVVFSPWRTTQLRAATVAMMWSFHAGIELCFNVGLFPWVSAVSWAVFIPTSSWDRLQALAAGATDGVARLLKGLAPRRRIRWLRPRPLKWRPRLGVEVAVALLALYSLFSTAARYKGYRWERIPYVFRLDQSWSMFAPGPFKDDGWFVVEGRLRDGARVDLLKDNEPVSWEKPESVIAEHESTRWRNYLLKFRRSQKQRDERLEYYCRYLCEQWARKDDESKRLVDVKVHYMLETTPPPGHPLPVARKLLLWEHTCERRRASTTGAPLGSSSLKGPPVGQSMLDSCRRGRERCGG